MFFKTCVNFFTDVTFTDVTFTDVTFTSTGVCVFYDSCVVLRHVLILLQMCFLLM